MQKFLWYAFILILVIIVVRWFAGSVAVTGALGSASTGIISALQGSSLTSYPSGAPKANAQG